MTVCPRCEKQVYQVEQALGPNGFYHKTCLTCKECNRRLDSTTLTEREKEIYCKTCYSKNFGPKAYGYNLPGHHLSTEAPNGIANSDSQNNLSSSRSGELSGSRGSVHASNASLSGNTSYRPKSQVASSIGNVVTANKDECPTCHKTVYFAEQVVGPNSVKYHKICFKCTSCRKTLDGVSCTPTNDGTPYCKTCYGKSFGPKGYGYANGGATIMNA